MVRNKWLSHVALMLLVAAGATAQEQPGAVVPIEERTEEVVPPVSSEEPKPELKRPTVWGEPTEVQVRVFMIDLDDVNSADQNFAASVYYEARWTSRFLVHEGPGPIRRRVTEVWTPRLVLVNQQMGWPAFPGSVEIYPNGEAVYRQKVWGRFSQPLDLRDFPLDRQVLTIHLAGAGLLREEVKLVDNESDIAPQFSIADFDLTGWKVEPAAYPSSDNPNAAPGFRMQLEVRRQFGYFVMKIIVPLCLIVLMSCAPRFIDPEQIGTNIGVSTTAFLTLVAYLFATTALLPRVSYITRIDRFVFLATLIVFLGLVQTIASTMMVRNERTAMVRKLDRWSRFGYPVVLVVVLVLAFVI